MTGWVVEVAVRSMRDDSRARGGVFNPAPKVHVNKFRPKLTVC